jgi:replicative DNA helicase
MPDGPLGESLLGLSQRLPPANIAAEQALLGALLANNKAFDLVPFLLPVHFADPVNGRIFEAISRRVTAGKLADAITLKAEFENAGTLEDVGGVAYLGHLLASMVGIINAGEYAKAVHDAWMRRQIIATAEDMVHRAFSPEAEETGATIVAGGVQDLLALDAGDAAQAVTMEQALTGAVFRAEAAFRGDRGQGRLDTGVRTFDGLWGGMWPGHLHYLMARSRTGKTSAALQIARNVAQRLLDEHIATKLPPEHVHIVSLEMNAEDLGVVQLTQVTRWTADQIRAGDIGGPDAWLELEGAKTDLSDLPIVIDAPSGMTFGELSARARVVRRTRKTRLLIVDYMALIRPDPGQARMSKPEWIPFLGAQMKGLAKALGVPIIALTQINKPKERDIPTRPTLGDLPYDGGQDADAVFCLWRPEIDLDTECPDFAGHGSEEQQAKKRSEWWARRNSVRNVAEFGALKRRFGPTGWKKMKFDGPRMLFVDPPDPDAPPDEDGE